MNKQYKHILSIRNLNAVESAIAERQQQGFAEETRFGFIATVANATPPVDEGFQQALRDRIRAETNRQAGFATKMEQEVTTRRKNIFLSAVKGLERLLPSKLWSLPLKVGIPLVATLILALIFIVTLQTAPWKLDDISSPSLENPPTVLSLPQNDVDALAERLNAEQAPRTVVVYPPDYTPSLAEHIQHNVVPLMLGSASGLGTVLPPGGLVDVILIRQNDNATDSDSGLVKEVRAMLERQLYRLYRPGVNTEPETFGTLQRTLYVAGPEKVTLEPIKAHFDNGIELVSAGVLDNAQPDASLRIALKWRTEQRVDTPVTVFTHLLCEGQIIAQRDAGPGNGAFPAPSWQPGEIVPDQFALQLPPDLPAGACRVQVGLYNPTSGLRHTLIKADVETSEGNTVAIIKRLTVKD